MLSLARNSLTRRAGTFLATFLVLLFGAVMIMAFAAMLDTAGQADRISAAGEETLTTMGSVVGGWGLCLVAFAAASTIGLSVRQRSAEIGLLKSAGATPAQITRMVVAEAGLVALVAAAAAVAPAYAAGSQLLRLLVDTGQVDAQVSFAFGPIALSIGFGVTVLSSVLAAWTNARAKARSRVTEVLLDAATDTGRMTWKRIVPAVVLIVAGVYLGVLTLTALRDKGPDAMPVAGQSAILVSIGLALLAPGLVRLAIAAVGRLLAHRSTAGYLMVQNLRHRTGQAAASLTPVILFTGIGTGILYLQLIENQAAEAAGYTATNEQTNIQTLNLVVIGMIVAFACIMLINTIIAATTQRAREFAQLRLAGATPPQVLATVRAEGALVVLTGIVAGAVAGMCTVIPYSMVRTDQWIPAVTPWLFVGIVAVAVTATLGAGLGSTRRLLRQQTIEAMA
ncbi:FtsX-like permease family protein [Streptomyces sp. NPDC002795]|uniref:ABC transporter permease n=1 Tax=Streptomyces sp. NPDC002795 TaxID=3364665 RepID=UPI0036B00EFD